MVFFVIGAPPEFTHHAQPASVAAMSADASVGLRFFKGHFFQVSDDTRDVLVRKSFGPKARPFTARPSADGFGIAWPERGRPERGRSYTFIFSAFLSLENEEVG